MNSLRNLVICSLLFAFFGCEPTDHREGSWFGGESKNQAPEIEIQTRSDGHNLFLVANVTDAEDDELSFLWQIDIGEEEPIERFKQSDTYTFDEKGNYNVTLFVDDGHGYVSESIDVEIEDPIVITPALLFEQLCSDCHSEDGTQNFPIDYSRFNDRPALTDYIHTYMPSNDTQACDEQCAETLSIYLSGYNELFMQVTDLEAALAMYTNPDYGYCNTCHEGTDGKSVKILIGSRSEFNWNRFDAVTDLVNFVEHNMPLNDHEACSEVDNCALLAGTYMWSQKDVVEGLVNVEGQELFDSQCSICHQINGLGSSQEEGGYTMLRFREGIDPDNLTHVEYPDKASFIDKVALSMPLGNASENCQIDCATKITDYLWEINNLEVEEEYSCSNPNYVQKQVRLLTRFEYENTLKDTLNLDVSEIIAYFPKEIGGDNFENDVGSANVDAARVQEFWNAALSIAQAAIAVHESFPLFDCDINEEQCVSSFVENTGQLLFRRPLQEDEQARFEALFGGELTEDNPMTGVQLTLQAMLSSPNFLYRSEIGVQQEGEEISTLTPYETAALLSYTFTASTPDEELMLAALNNELNSPEQLSTQVSRLLETQRAEDQLRRFVAQWFGADEIMDLPRNYVQFTAFTDEIRASMKTEFDLFVGDIIFNDLPVERLLDADYSYLNQPLADYYGVQATINPGEFAKTSFGDAKRQGVISMGAVISSHAKGDENSPVFRGIFVRKDLLCQDLPSPPDISGEGGGFDPSLPVRERLALHTTGTGCYNCHKVIDDLGYALENYNAIGQYIEYEYIASTGVVMEDPIDSSGVLVGIESFLDSTSEPFNDALELATIISQNDVSKQCAIEKWQQYSYGRTQEIVCQKSSLYDLWQDKEFTMKQLLIESVKVPGYLIRQ